MINAFLILSVIYVKLHLLEYKREDLDALAALVIQAQSSLTGVQPKLSLNLHNHEGSNRLNIADKILAVIYSNYLMVQVEVLYLPVGHRVLFSTKAWHKGALLHLKEV